MASTFTNILRVELQADGENENTWGQKLNEALDKLEHAIAGRVALVLASSDITLSTANGGDGTADQAAAMILDLSGTLTGDVNIIAPNRSKLYVIHNACTQTAGETVSIKTATGAAFQIPIDSTNIVWCDGLDSFRLATKDLEDSGSFTATLTGFSSNPQGTINWYRVGNQITLVAPGVLSGTSNANSMQMTGLPSNIVPTFDSGVPCVVLNNGVNTFGLAIVDNNGTIRFSIHTTGGISENGFFIFGSKGLGTVPGWSITYALH